MLFEFWGPGHLRGVLLYLDIPWFYSFSLRFSMVVDSNTIVSHVKNNKVLVISIFIALLISFYGGMRYQQYRFQKAVTNAFGELGKAFGEGLSGKGSAVKASEVKPKENPLNANVSVVLQDKTFVPDEFFSKLSFKLNITNKGDKAIKGVQGRLIFKDVFDNEMQSIRVSYDNSIPAGSSKVWEGSIGYSDSSEEDVKLKNTAITDLKYTWDTDTIVYEDGTKETN